MESPPPLPTAAPLPSQRDLFDLPRDVAYLNCGYMSPLLRAATAAGRAALERKARPWTITPPDFFREPEEARRLAAALLGGAADDIALVPSASYGMAVAAANLPLGAGQRVLLLQDSFPSVVYTWQARARDRGAEAVLLPRPADHDWTRAVLEAIDRRTAVAALPACHWTDGARLDLVRIRGRLNEVGAALAVDATQSLGAMPLDVRRVRPDFLVAAAYKWLLGPYSVGYLYVAPAWQGGAGGGRPIEHNWIARRGSEDFAGLTAYQDAYQPGARRYDVGEVSNFALLPAATAALRQILAWGVPAVYATAGRLADLIVERCARFSLTAVPENRRARHYLGLRRAGGLPADLAAQLAGRGVYVSLRGGALRITPHLYNDEEDVARLIEALDHHLG